MPEYLSICLIQLEPMEFSVPGIWNGGSDRAEIGTTRTNWNQNNRNYTSQSMYKQRPRTLSY